MGRTQPCPLAVELASHMRSARAEITERWLERIAARVHSRTDRPPADHVPAGRAGPPDELRDHVPVLLDGIAAYLEDPADEITADAPVAAKAMELGALRFAQGFDMAEIMKEYEILGGVLYSFSTRMLAKSDSECRAEDLMICAHRIFRAVSVIEQLTTTRYLRMLGERVAEREERLRRFSRMITHELKNRVGATLGAGQLLQEEWLGIAERKRFAGMVEENAREIQKVLENLTALSRLDGERRRQRNIALPEVVAEVFRQLRDMARGRDVDLRIEGELPNVEVNAAALELCLSNYLSNAIKYSDDSASERWAAVSAALGPGPDRADELVVRVRDNGVGVPTDVRDRLFERFFRGHTDTMTTEGTGLGLSLVQEAAESFGGRAWAEFDDRPGSTFVVALPCGDEESSGCRGISDSADGRRSGDAPRQAAERETESD